jgi:hypothetical protein
MNAMKDRERLEKKLAEIDLKVYGLSVEMGAEGSVPLNTRSSAKIHNLQLDLDRNRADRDKIYGELVELVNSPSYEKALAEQTTKLVARRNELAADLEALNGELSTYAPRAARNILAGANPLEAAEAERMMREQGETIGRAIWLLNLAIANLTRPIAPVPNAPVEWVQRLPEFNPHSR